MHSSGGHLETFLAEASEHTQTGLGYPKFIEKEFRAYLRCGILAYGFARVVCTVCKDEDLVVFSCKQRGLCPSCQGRRMADTAAHLVDHILPEARYRQWTLSLPKRIRFLMLKEPKLLRDVRSIGLRKIFSYQLYPTPHFASRQAPGSSHPATPYCPPGRKVSFELPMRGTGLHARYSLVPYQKG